MKATDGRPRQGMKATDAAPKADEARGISIGIFEAKHRCAFGT